MKRFLTYTLINKIHLYCSLLTVTLLIMYLATSYMMIYHNWFNPSIKNDETISVEVNPSDIADDNWDLFRSTHGIDGRLAREQKTESGDMMREYESVAKNYKVTIAKHQDEVKIRILEKNLNGTIIGFHRMRGFGGPLQYSLYAVLLDIVGLSLILFAITGIIMWLRILNHNKIAWTILTLGFVYVSSVIGYLL